MMVLSKMCPTCKQTFFSNREKAKFCSKRCSAVSGGHAKQMRHNQSGSNNPNWKEGISKDHYHYKLLQKKRYPKRIKAREAVSYAIRHGKLSRGVCEMCGKEDAHAHHDDYDRPLDIRWFCRDHHRQVHGGIH